MDTTRLKQAALEHPEFISNPDEAISRLQMAVEQGLLIFNSSALDELDNKSIANHMLTALGKLTHIEINAYMNDLGKRLRNNEPEAIAQMKRNLDCYPKF